MHGRQLSSLAMVCAFVLATGCSGDIRREILFAPDGERAFPEAFVLDSIRDRGSPYVKQLVLALKEEPTGGYSQIPICQALLGAMQDEGLREIVCQGEVTEALTENLLQVCDEVAHIVFSWELAEEKAIAIVRPRFAAKIGPRGAIAFHDSYWKGWQIGQLEVLIDGRVVRTRERWVPFWRAYDIIDVGALRGHEKDVGRHEIIVNALIRSPCGSSSKYREVCVFEITDANISEPPAASRRP